MKILVLTSRYTATRDIIEEDFGRQTRIFTALRKLGHHIDFFVADYKKHENRSTMLHGINTIIKPFGIWHFFHFVDALDKQLIREKYDVLIATSDPLWGVIGCHYAKRHRIKFVYDLHDNYETYSTYNLPFFRYFDSNALKRADIVITVSFSLKDKVLKKRKENVFVVKNGVDTKLFRPLNKNKCRKELNLPKDAKIIGYTGSIQRLQGIDVLVDAFNGLKKEIKNLKLVIAGRFFEDEEKKINLSHNGIIYLGSLPQKKIVKLINAADIVAIPNPENDFTKYCFPYKVVEYMACNRPIVATKVGDVALLLRNFNNSLCNPNDKSDMMKRIKIQLKTEKINYRKTALKNSWELAAKNLEKILTS